jgi:hypothetical protein
VPQSPRGTGAQTQQGPEAVEGGAKKAEQGQLEEKGLPPEGGVPAAMEAGARQALRISIGDQGFSFATAGIRQEAPCP